MGRRHVKPEQIIHMLREAEIKLAGGKKIGVSRGESAHLTRGRT